MIMVSTWAKAALLLASCGGLVACAAPDNEAFRQRPQSAVPASAHAQPAFDADLGKYDVLKAVQPVDRAVEF
jgi:hypothetical protein